MGVLPAFRLIPLRRPASIASGSHGGGQPAALFADLPWRPAISCEASSHFRCLSSSPARAFPFGVQPAFLVSRVAPRRPASRSTRWRQKAGCGGRSIVRVCVTVFVCVSVFCVCSCVRMCACVTVGVCVCVWAAFHRGRLPLAVGSGVGIQRGVMLRCRSAPERGTLFCSGSACACGCRSP